MTDHDDPFIRKLDFDKVVYFKINQLIGRIESFKGSWQVLEQTKGGYLKELRKIATIESIASSTRIEGATLTDKEVETLLRDIKINKLESRDEQEIVGYYEALELILESYTDIPFTINYVHHLHSILLKYGSKDQSHKGRFKNLSNKVVANYPDGSQRVIFRATEPHLTESEMAELLQWVTHQFSKEELHPLIITAVFVYEFLSIHPYQDGNGRLSRLLTTLLLLQNNYRFVEYVSFEHIVENKKEAYYKALIAGQKNRYKDNERVDEWLLFFLESLTELTSRLETKYQTYSQLKIHLNDRQRQVLAYIEREKVVQMKDLEKALGGYSRNTLKKDVSYLTNEGLLIRTGAGRGVRYHFKSD